MSRKFFVGADIVALSSPCFFQHVHQLSKRIHCTFVTMCGASPSGDTSMMMMPMSDHALLSAPEAKQLPLIELDSNFLE